MHDEVAFKWLEKGLEERDSQMVLIEVGRGSTRFAKIPDLPICFAGRTGDTEPRHQDESRWNCNQILLPDVRTRVATAWGNY